jgi:hypothetical protein
MVNITKLYCGIDTTGDPLRYGHKRGPQHGTPRETEQQAHEVPPSARERKPIVVWTMSRRCNLRCIHYYSDSANQAYAGELTTPEVRAMLTDLAQFEIPALLMSGGEPLYHPQFFAYAEFARSLGLRLTISTNGTLIDQGTAQRIKQTARHQGTFDIPTRLAGEHHLFDAISRRSFLQAGALGALGLGLSDFLKSMSSCRQTPERGNS